MIENTISQHLVAAIQTLYAHTIEANVINIQATPPTFEGQLTVLVFPLVKCSKKSPEQTASDLGHYLQTNSNEIIGFNVVKGFLNLSIADTYWLSEFKNNITKPDFAQFPPNGQKVLVEYSSPNTNKPLHLGHIRNNLLGFSVASLLKAAGYDVIKVNLVNDRGIHICKSMLAWQLIGNGESPQSTGLKGDHLAGKYYVLFDKTYKQQIAHLVQEGQSEEEAKKNAPIFQQAQALLRRWEAGDKEVIALWKMMNTWVYAGFEQTYRTLGVDFDHFYYESDTYLLGKDLVQEGVQKGVFFQKADGSIWVDLTADGLDEKLLLRSDGTSVYITQDLGTAMLKCKEFAADKSIYVVGNEQDYHFKVLFKTLAKLGYTWAKDLFHLSYGMVDLPSGKMKSREGTVVDADDLIQEMIDTAREHTQALGKVDHFSEPEKEKLYHTIALGALKYFLLKVEPKKRLLFDPKESIDFQGHTGPFIQYTHARICSILNKADYEDHHPADYNISHLVPCEQALLLSLRQWPSTITHAAQAYSPALIAQYLYELAKLYNRFYHEVAILKTEQSHSRNFRLALSSITAQTLKRGLSLLGIEAPERM